MRLTITGGRERLAAEALSLKKAWLLLAVMRGEPLRQFEARIWAYDTWSRKQLSEHCRELEDHFDNLLAGIVKIRAAKRASAARWLASQFDRWLEAGAGSFTIANVSQFETAIGRLNCHAALDLPPYAEVLLQPGHPMAFRHPEYMLVRDVGLLFDLYRDAETLCASADGGRPRKWATTAGENVQTLARATIQGCFNLLESFVSGLAQSHVMTNPKLEEKTIERLLSTRDPLRRRIRQIPALIAGRECPLTLERDPLRILFDDIKRRRDAFVHCEPGSIESAHGYVKEAVFNDLPVDLVPNTIRATHAAIRRLWLFVHSREGPRWLPDIDESGRFGKPNLTLQPRIEDAADGARPKSGSI